MSQFLYGSNVAVNNIRLHYLRYGGRGQSLVLIPGITSPAITWGFVAEKLAEYFDVYVLDVRGRGLSSSGDHLEYDTDTCAIDILEFVQKLELSNYILVGHSMGARFAIRCAAYKPKDLQKIVLIDPPVSGPHRRAYPSQLPWYVDSIQQSIVGMNAEQMKQFCPTWTLEQRQLRAEWLHTCYLPAIIKAFNDFHEVDIHQYLPDVEVPALLMVAGKGGVIQAEDILEIQALNSKVVVSHVTDAGHMIPWDDLTGFYQGFGNFLGQKIV
ncbi:alpha/beta hydrolase [Acinetobacter sp. ANC 4558]|uniref:alpha/beta fold hydrolase n=1 Tax=Acinetobacter sp. ANC 4558 TaxID=1977876 RepID=UPI000A356E08|nr:alpha/beta hydrolase [Acinetobacter sp. ANC 4558]OTG87647.1 alpha/beta hydrolase [Acinetobacter sp. ANC 4558]